MAQRYSKCSRISEGGRYSLQDVATIALGIKDAELGLISNGDNTRISDLTTSLGVERRRVQDQTLCR